MKAHRVCISLGLLLLYLSIAPNFFIHCEARNWMQLRRESEEFKEIKAVKHTFLEQMMTQLNLAQPLDSSNTQPYGVSSPFTLPPFDSLPPENAPPLCVSPPKGKDPQIPNTNSPPSSAYPTPPESSSNPNPPMTIPSPFVYSPGPPESTFSPSPPGSTFSPNPSGPTLGPPYYEPGPPAFIPNPPSGIIPSPTGFIPNPPIILPPIVFPQPTGPSPPHVSPSSALWCVAKPSVPDPIIQEAMNYACGTGADCNSIQLSGPCFTPNTLIAHASYAFNSYWQRTKAAGGTCDFGSTAMLIAADPSYDGCHFDYF